MGNSAKLVITLRILVSFSITQSLDTSGFFCTRLFMEIFRVQSVFASPRKYFGSRACLRRLGRHPAVTGWQMLQLICKFWQKGQIASPDESIVIFTMRPQLPKTK